jgi:hypothetical protein
MGTHNSKNARVVRLEEICVTGRTSLDLPVTWIHHVPDDLEDTRNEETGAVTVADFLHYTTAPSGSQALLKNLRELKTKQETGRPTSLSRNQSFQPFPLRIATNLVN